MKINRTWYNWWIPTPKKVEVKPVVHNVLNIGSRGDLVKELQSGLKKVGYDIIVDGIFGNGTDSIVKDFQRRNGLIADGIVGAKTTLLINKRVSSGWKIEPPKKGLKLTENNIINFANKYGLEVAAVKAVHEVESRGSGFFKSGKIKILFEGHIFWRQLQKRGISPLSLVKGNENVLHKRWVRTYYGQNQHDRLYKAKRIHLSAALESASYGLFQVMGFHWESLGFDSVEQFVEFMENSEANQLEVFGRFVKKNGLLRHLRSKDWARFARGYNGPGYKRNKYDTKMAMAYRKHL